MEELIKLDRENKRTPVSARDLYEFLEIKTDFTDWCKRMFEYGFTEGIDFTSFLGKSTGGRPSVGYAFSIDMAKEISMIQRTEKGKMARLYFIECEKLAKEVKIDFSDPNTVLQLAQNWADEQAKRIEAERIIEEQKPKVLFAQALEVSEQSILIGQLAKILKNNGIEIGQNRLFLILREEGYLHKSGEQYNSPTQKSMELGLLETKTTTINNPDGSVRVTRTTKVKPKGQQYFINKFMNK